MENINFHNFMLVWGPVLGLFYGFGSQHAIETIIKHWMEKLSYFWGHCGPTNRAKVKGPAQTFRPWRNVQGAWNLCLEVCYTHLVTPAPAGGAVNSPASRIRPGRRGGLCDCLLIGLLACALFFRVYLGCFFGEIPCASCGSSADTFFTNLGKKAATTAILTRTGMTSRRRKLLAETVLT